MKKVWIAYGILVVAIAYAVPVLSQGPALPPGEYDLEAGQYVFNVPPLAGTPLPTDTATASPPTDTPVPPTDVPGAHNDTEWHPVSADVSHTHNANPSSMDHIFGPVGQYTAGQEISYPWQTWRGLDADPFGPPAGPGDMENDFKHEGYKWHVGEITECRTAYFHIAPASGCVVAWRIEHHAVGGPVGAAARLHSYWAELKVCAPQDGILTGPSGFYPVDLNDCGFYRQGGFVDYGGLRTKPRDGNIPIHLPYEPEGWDGGGFAYREHEMLPLGDTPNNRANWSSLSSELNHGVTFAFSTDDDFAELDINDPGNLDFANFRCPDLQCEFNHSTEGFYRIDVEMEYLNQFDDGSGRANFNGFTDRFGNVVSSGCALGPDCIPLIIENIPTGGRAVMYQSHGTPGFYEDFDLSPPGEFWISWPN
ncbi:hypothetical protein LCGC14_1373230 [marine sediment metagenome]|uniref:Uncharacterized protein n=1 Tax=marine sediment metagenome TaxID=412755 RepID=A0A0F9K541_9ZZZZ